MTKNNTFRYVKAETNLSVSVKTNGAAVCVKWLKLAVGVVNVQQADQKLCGLDNKSNQQFLVDLKVNKTLHFFLNETR